MSLSNKEAVYHDAQLFRRLSVEMDDRRILPASTQEASNDAAMESTRSFGFHFGVFNCAFGTGLQSDGASGGDAAVEAVFPQSLRFAPDAELPLHPYHTCAVVFSATPDGTPDLVAAAYSGDGAEVALLSYKSGVAKIIDAVTDRQFWLFGDDCETEMVNLANPEQPDSTLAHVVKVSFQGQVGKTCDNCSWKGWRLCTRKGY